MRRHGPLALAGELIGVVGVAGLRGGRPLHFPSSWEVGRAQLVALVTRRRDVVPSAVRRRPGALPASVVALVSAGRLHLSLPHGRVHVTMRARWRMSNSGHLGGDQTRALLIRRPRSDSAALAFGRWANRSIGPFVQSLSMMANALKMDPQFVMVTRAPGESKPIFRE